MTLDDLANYVSVKSQLVEADDIAAAKLFLSQRYELIYNEYMWKDSLCYVNVPFDPVNNLDNANGIILLPTQIDRLVAIRTANSSLEIQGLEYFYRIDWNKFGDTSNCQFTPNEMAILSPIWFTVRPVDPSLTLIDTSGLTYGIHSVFPTHPYFASGAIDIPVANGIYKIILGADDFGLADQSDTQPAVGDIIYAQVTNGILTLYGNAGGSNVGVSLYLVDISELKSLAGSTMTITSDNAVDTLAGTPVGQDPIQVKVTWRDNTDRYTITSTLPLTLTPADGDGQIEIESVFKPATSGNITFTTSSTFTGNNALTGNTLVATELSGSLSPTTLKSPSHQRVRIFPIPTAATTLNVLGKKPFIPLTFSTEVPAIRNLDNTLIAFAMGDMMTRARFPQEESQPFYQEASILLKELALLETLQAANCSLIQFSDGFGQGIYNPRRNGFGNYY